MSNFFVESEEGIFVEKEEAVLEETENANKKSKSVELEKNGIIEFEENDDKATLEEYEEATLEENEEATLKFYTSQSLTTNERHVLLFNIGEPFEVSMRDFDNEWWPLVSNIWTRFSYKNHNN
ncbi:14520_t:CDS:1, partial [Racocetra persica]